MRIMITLFLCLFVLVPASAEQRYSTWNSPDSPASSVQEDRVQEFVDRLNALINEGEKARAADPRFLRDLRDLSRGYHRPWRKRVLFDDFVDGDFSANPVWTVSSGRFWVERDWGLRSEAEAPAAQSSDSGQQQPEQEKVSGRKAAIAIFGAVLDKALGQKGSQQENQQGSSQTGTSAGGVVAETFTAIHSAAPITNAFAIELDISSWLNKGRLEIGPYQGASRSSGYRLIYTPGGGLELLRVSSRGSSIIRRVAGPLNLEDKKPHAIEWTRRADGEMAVSVDGKELLSATDRGFTDPFDGLQITNAGGDFILKRISVFSAD